MAVKYVQTEKEENFKVQVQSQVFAKYALAS